MKKTCVTILIMISSACLVCIGFYYLLGNLNTGSHPIENIESLLITESDLPTGWKLDYIMPITGSYRWGIENRLIAFEFENEEGFAYQHIYRFRNIFSSMRGYSRMRRELPIIKENRDNYTNISDFAANDWFLACDHNQVGGEMYDYLGRYEDYVVWFSFSAVSEALTPSDFEKVLRTIDHSMKLFLGK